MHSKPRLSLLLLALIAPACGGGGNAPSQTKAPPQSATENDINATPREKIQEGGKFTWPLDAIPANFNYNELDGTSFDGAHVLEALMPAPYTNDAVGAPVWNRDILASEPKLVTEPQQVVTYQINPKAIWYDGTPITWQDFYWQWKASNGSSKAYQISGSQGYEDIENIAKGQNDREVVVTFKHKYADWSNVFNPFYPASTNKDPKVFNDGWKAEPLTTAGPFKLGSIDVTAKTITLVRNEKWWGDRAKLDSIVFRVIEPDAQIDALANGEIDAMDNGSDANKYRRAKAISGVEVREAGGPNFSHVTFNGTSANLQDVRVRRAVAMGIDRAAVARALLGPLNIDAKPLNNHIFMANQAGYQDNSGDVGKYDPEKARQALEEAGWKLDGSVRKKDGRPLDLTLVIPTGIATSKQIAELIQNMLGQVGVGIKISAVPINDFFDKYVTPGQFDLVLFSWMGTPYPISSTKSVYVKPSKNAQGEMSIRQNYARIGSDEIDRLFEQANGELDRKKAVALANQIDALLWQEVHSLTLFQRPELVICKKNLANFGAFGFTTPWVYQDIGWGKTS